jgi:hypothetical protein
MRFVGFVGFLQGGEGCGEISDDERRLKTPGTTLKRGTISEESMTLGL